MLYGDIAFTGAHPNGLDNNHNSAYFFWIPLFGPLIGGVIGVMIYTLLISAHWPEDEQIESFDDVVRQSVEDSNL